tara:strand:+ start:4345 stop:4755 length:411 start_codon:yes stop_codon:yes gene_type:complete
MREIKFRAWDDKNKKWAFKDFNLLGDVMLFDLLGQYKLEEHCELLVEQFTGLKDVNSKDIYEGDILSPKFYTKTEFGNCIVGFKNGTFGLLKAPPFITKFTALHGAILRGKTAANEFVIIGNIHENPKLLQESEDA